jgi:hypothetical protein
VTIVNRRGNRRQFGRRWCKNQQRQYYPSKVMSPLNSVNKRKERPLSNIQSGECRRQVTSVRNMNTPSSLKISISPLYKMRLASSKILLRDDVRRRISSGPAIHLLFR